MSTLTRNETAHQALRRKHIAKTQEIRRTHAPRPGLDTLEAQADEALRIGDFRTAEQKLTHIRGNRELRAIYKLASIPFYRLDHTLRHEKPIPAQLASDVECVHADLTEVIRIGRARYLETEASRGQRGESHAMKQLRGLIGECSVAALIARRYNAEGQSFMLPAPVADDKAPRGGRAYSYGIDGIIGRHNPAQPGGPRSIQVKSSRYSSDTGVYSPSIQVIYTHDLPNGQLQQRHPAALSRLLIDEVDATISDFHLRKVSAADTYINSLINPHQ